MKTFNSKTKILSTLGPATENIECIERLVDKGVDGFRLNFSHGSYDWFKMVLMNIDEVCRRKSMPIAVLVDLQGPKIRVGELEKPAYELEDDNIIELTTEEIIGNEKIIYASYPNLVADSVIGEFILINDGLIKLQITEIKEKSILCKIINGGELKPRKGINFPGLKLSVPSLTEKDYKDLNFAINFRVDFIALSFVRTASDIVAIKEYLNAKGKKISVIAKIEKPEAVKNIDSIIETADGIMVARGDLGVEMEPYEVPSIQKNIIRKCNKKGKLVITATQMLETMIHNPVPTRAEASDVANAVWDGTDVVMLSGETSVGAFPVKTVDMMNNILLTTEKHPEFKHPLSYEIPQNMTDNVFDSTGKAITEIAEQINAAAIVVFTHFGRKAKVISKFKPKVPIIAFSDLFTTLNFLNLHYGIYPYFLTGFDNEEFAIEEAKKILELNKIAEKGDLIIFTSGAPITDSSRRSWNRYVVL